jgi:tRNA(adenine34) deaminase
VNQSEQDEFWMRRAIELAAQAEALGEVPVGAVIVCDDEMIGEGFNQPITANDPTAHAEIVALRNAAKKINNYRLVGASLYVTLEPCTMCVGALIHSRIQRLIYATTEPKSGAVQSRSQLLSADYFNHKIEVTSGVLAQQCQHQLSAFFQRRREQKKSQTTDSTIE